MTHQIDVESVIKTIIAYARQRGCDPAAAVMAAADADPSLREAIWRQMIEDVLTDKWPPPSSEDGDIVATNDTELLEFLKQRGKL
jgi:hypothetical protein